MMIYEDVLDVLSFGQQKLVVRSFNFMRALAATVGTS
jgi:hypothetical protein